MTRYVIRTASGDLGNFEFMTIAVAAALLFLPHLAWTVEPVEAEA